MTLENLSLTGGVGSPSNHGGGVNIRGGSQTVIITDSVIANNQTLSYGGGLAAIDNANVILINTSVSGNTSNGAGIGTSGGGGIYCENSDISMFGSSRLSLNTCKLPRRRSLS